MSDARRRYRNKKRDDHRPMQGAGQAAPVTIARREDPRCVQPKILLKKDKVSDPCSGSSNQDLSCFPKTLIINRCSDGRSEKCRPSGGSAAASGYHPVGCLLPSVASVHSTSVCAALASGTSNDRDKTSSGSGSGAALLPAQDLQPPRMMRTTPLIVSNGVFNASARKLFHKTNTDFTVIGVLGGQGVGKSTLLNLLAAERPLDYDYYQHLFSPKADECTFHTRHKHKPSSGQNQKSILRPRTEALQFFITRERFILLDTPPLLVANGKEADYLELHSLAPMSQMLTICHILLLAIDEVSLEQLHLLHTALRLRPRTPCKGYVRDYLPHVMFVRTRAHRQHFEPRQRERLDKQLVHLFGSTGLHIYRGRGDARCLNSFLLPEVYGNGATAHHACLGELVRQFRERVFSTTRVSMCQSNDLSEAIWFELLAESVRRATPHFEKIYAEIKHRHLDPRCQRRAETWRNFGNDAN
ncbi:protein SMG9 [Drosophila miranda]|uniref:protein SMG9 n=1 Tax=Drosophila miranda TaxID=7229 RepID=UPI0007E7C3A5|nr:protein SMG9 [Drosophila miranda]